MLTMVLASMLSTLMLVVGVRVLAIARAGGGSTEALIGGAFVAMGIGGIPALFAAHDTLFDAAWQAPLFAFGQALLSVAFACFFLFSWRCFGPDSAWRRALALAGVAAQVILFVALGVFERYEPPGGMTLRVGVLSRGAVMVWAFAESLRYWRMMKRRQQLGLVDPVVTNRFALWSCWTGGMVACVAVAAVSRLFLGELSLDFSSLRDSALLLAGMASLLLSITTLVLAFLPPAAFLRWVRAQA